MKKTKGFSVFCLLACMFLSFPANCISSCDPSNYIEGDIHSNSNYTVAIDSGHTNLNINGTVSAVGTATIGPDVNATSVQSGAANIEIPEIDFAGLEAANGQPIGSTQIMYIDGDVTIDLSDIAAYQNKTVVASGNIKVVRPSGSYQTVDLTANLIARGSIDICLHGCGPSEFGIKGLIYSRGETPIYVDHHDKGNFTGVNVDFSGCGHHSKCIQGIIMAKNGSFQLDVHGGGDGDSGIIGDASVTNDLIDFFDHLTYWREIRG